PTRQGQIPGGEDRRSPRSHRVTGARPRGPASDAGETGGRRRRRGTGRGGGLPRAHQRHTLDQAARPPHRRGLVLSGTEPRNDRGTGPRGGAVAGDRVGECVGRDAGCGTRMVVTRNALPSLLLPCAVEGPGERWGSSA